MTAVNRTQCSSVSQLLDHAHRACSRENFSLLVRRALRRMADAGDFDACFVEFRQRVHGWLDEPPENVDAADVAQAFIEFVDRFTPEHGVRWYPIRDHDRYPDVSDWFCEDAALLSQIEEAVFDAAPRQRRSPAEAASALLARLHLRIAELEVIDA